MDAIKLVVRGDDLGMCHAVNDGIAAAWSDGILSQTTAMVPCPWFAEGATSALDLGIPTAVHMTLTAEWDHIRWRPVTGPTTVAGPDGTFWRTVPEVHLNVDPDDAVTEIVAQVECFRATGLEPTGLDPHMAAFVPASVASIVDHFALPFFHAGRDDEHIDSNTMLTTRRDKTAWLQNWLRELGPGTHLLITHPAVASPELEALTAPDADNRPWADLWRITDLEALTDPEVRDIVESRGIQLVAHTPDGGTTPRHA